MNIEHFGEVLEFHFEFFKVSLLLFPVKINCRILIPWLYLLDKHGGQKIQQIMIDGWCHRICDPQSPDKFHDFCLQIWVALDSLEPIFDPCSFSFLGNLYGIAGKKVELLPRKVRQDWNSRKLEKMLFLVELDRELDNSAQEFRLIKFVGIKSILLCFVSFKYFDRDQSEKSSKTSKHGLSFGSTTSPHLSNLSFFRASFCYTNCISKNIENLLKM